MTEKYSAFSICEFHMYQNNAIFKMSVCDQKFRPTK